MIKFSKSFSASDSKKVITLHRIYVRDISLEVPNNPHVFGDKWQPKVDAHINTSSQKLPEDFYESILKVEITAKNQGKLAFIIEVTQCATFLLKNLTKDELRITLGVTCPTTLFPYARETVDNLLMKGGMPPLHLAQINFQSLFEDRNMVVEKDEPSRGDNKPERKRKLVIENPSEGKLS